MAGRATATADRMNEQATSGTVNALAKLSDASDAMDAHEALDARRILARRVARTADRLNQQGVTMTLNAVGKVPTLAEALRGTPDAWPALAEARASNRAAHARAGRGGGAQRTVEDSGRAGTHLRRVSARSRRAPRRRRTR